MESWNDKKGTVSSPGNKSEGERLNSTQDRSQSANSWLLILVKCFPSYLEVQKAVFVSLNFQYL